MTRLDVDGDGCVDRGELLAAIVDWQRLQGSDAGCAADFSSPPAVPSSSSSSSSSSAPSSSFPAAAASASASATSGCDAARAQWRDWVTAAFDKLDADGSGCIDLSELAALVKSQQAGTSAASSSSSSSSSNDALREAAELLREADADGDGSPGRSSRRC